MICCENVVDVELLLGVNVVLFYFLICGGNERNKVQVYVYIYLELWKFRFLSEFCCCWFFFVLSGTGKLLFF